MIHIAVDGRRCVASPADMSEAAESGERSSRRGRLKARSTLPACDRGGLRRSGRSAASGRRVARGSAPLSPADRDPGWRRRGRSPPHPIRDQALSTATSATAGCDAIRPDLLGMIDCAGADHLDAADDRQMAGCIERADVAGGSSRRAVPRRLRPLSCHSPPPLPPWSAPRRNCPPRWISAAPAGKAAPRSPQHATDEFMRWKTPPPVASERGGSAGHRRFGSAVEGGFWSEDIERTPEWSGGCEPPTWIACRRAGARHWAQDRGSAPAASAPSDVRVARALDDRSKLLGIERGQHHGRAPRQVAHQDHLRDRPQRADIEEDVVAAMSNPAMMLRATAAGCSPQRPQRPGAVPPEKLSVARSSPSPSGKGCSEACSSRVS